jgi:CubicO group peptidase (beta-lactamase class C family)
MKLKARSRLPLVGLLAVVLHVGFGCAPAAAPAPAPSATQARGAAAYVPPAGTEWERRAPEQLGMDAARLQEAVAFALANESTAWPTDLRQGLLSRFGSDPYNEIVGPTKDRGGPNGMILRDGYIVAEWGNTTDQVDMTFSISKSYLATTAGLALDEGLIRSVHDPVRAYAPDSLFSGRNDAITWHNLLQQTSEWEGMLWDKPDVADRREGRDRTLHQPGTFWEYNDVRVNLTALALLHVWKRPLPEVLQERVMNPIGASPRWQWHGYHNSFATIDGERMQSVSGGGHYGGGVWISTRDHARFGLLHLRKGKWGDRQILSERWVEMATAPTEIKPTYGYMWWLNTDRKLYPSAPETSFFALGAGTNLIWIDPEHDLVAVVRWIENDQVDAFIQRVMAAVLPSRGS